MSSRAARCPSAATAVCLCADALVSTPSSPPHLSLLGGPPRPVFCAALRHVLGAALESHSHGGVSCVCDGEMLRTIARVHVVTVPCGPCARSPSRVTLAAAVCAAAQRMT